MSETGVTVAGIDNDTEPVPYKSSAERATESGNPNGPAEDRENEVDMPALRAQHMEAALARRNGEDTETEAERALARQRSDPRFDNDQKILKLAQEGKLQAAQASDPSGLVAQGIVSAEVAEALPKSTEDQAAEDAEKLANIQEGADKKIAEGEIVNPNITTSTSSAEGTGSNGEGGSIK